MREILFRGKRLDNGEWFEGYLYEHEPALVGIVSENDVPEPSKWFIARTGFADWNMPRPVEFVEIDPSTVGQYTGKTVKNGKVFDGDIGKSIDGIFLVCWDEEKSAFVIRFMEYPYETLYLEEMWDDTEIVGNIHDNPELLEK